MSDRKSQGAQSGLQQSAYSRATSSGAVRRRDAAKSLAAQNRLLREAQQTIQKTKYHERELSPLATKQEHFETRLLNNDMNYGLSPAAKRARQDGSLDPS